MSRLYIFQQRSLRSGERHHQDFIVGKVGYRTPLEASAEISASGVKYSAPIRGNCARRSSRGTRDAFSLMPIQTLLERVRSPGSWVFMAKPLSKSKRQYVHVNNGPAQRLARKIPGVKPAPMPDYIEPL